MLRLDADASGLQQRAQTLERFAAAPAGVLVGTQMVAKGHDFPDVGLGVVLDADQTLRFPDFRAEERTFALITQLAGRAGRGAPGGRVLVQTTTPDARSIRFAARHDSDGFIQDELARREALSYPPFASLIRVVCSAQDSVDATAVATELREQIPAGRGCGAWSRATVPSAWPRADSACDQGTVALNRDRRRRRRGGRHRPVRGQASRQRQRGRRSPVGQPEHAGRGRG